MLAFVAIVTFNAVVALRNRIDKAWGNVEVVLRQRHDQLPALVDAVRDLMAFEQDVLEEVTRQRSRYAPDAPVPEQGAVSAATTAAVRSLFAVVEHYPQVRSQENVLRLQARDRAARGPDRRPPRALQRPGLPLQHDDRAGAGGRAGRGSSAGGRAPFFDAGEAAEQPAGRLAAPAGGRSAPLDWQSTRRRGPGSAREAWSTRRTAGRPAAAAQGPTDLGRAFEARGPVDAPVLVLLHGTRRTRAMWRHQLERPVGRASASSRSTCRATGPSPTCPFRLADATGPRRAP